MIRLSSLNIYSHWQIFIKHIKTCDLYRSIYTQHITYNFRDIKWISNILYINYIIEIYALHNFDDCFIPILIPNVFIH